MCDTKETLKAYILPHDLQIQILVGLLPDLGIFTFKQSTKDSTNSEEGGVIAGGSAEASVEGTNETSEEGTLSCTSSKHGQSILISESKMMSCEVPTEVIASDTGVLCKANSHTVSPFSFT